MGSTGSGRFTDYPGSRRTEVDAGGVAVAESGEIGVGATGGESGVDRCQQAFSVLLEDVGNSDLYAKTRTVPATGTVLQLAFRSGRIFAVDGAGTRVGALPTSHNYLLSCIESGVNYVGVVTAAAATPVPTVYADFKPQ